MINMLYLFSNKGIHVWLPIYPHPPVIKIVSKDRNYRCFYLTRKNNSQTVYLIFWIKIIKEIKKANIAANLNVEFLYIIF